MPKRKLRVTEFRNSSPGRGNTPPPLKMDLFVSLLAAEAYLERRREVFEAETTEMTTRVPPALSSSFGEKASLLPEQDERSSSWLCVPPR